MTQDPAVVIYRLGSLGDTVVALPCFHAIERAFAGQQRVVLTNFPVSSKAAPLETILADGGFIHRAIQYPVATRKTSSFLRLARELRDLKAKTLVYMVGGRGLRKVYRDLMFFRLCGFERIIGAPASAEDDQGRIDAGGLQEPEAERLSRCLAALGPMDLRDPAAWDLRLSAAEQAGARTILGPLAGKPFIAVNLGGKDPSKDWGEGAWADLLKELAPRLYAHGLVFVGGADDAPRAQRLIGLWRGPALDACGRATPRQSAALLSHASLFIGHDSGPMHLAAATGVRCVGLFGALNRPRKWHPYGEGHRVLHDTAGVGAIAVRDVTDAVMGAIAQPAL